jgi:hypothetical protein
VAGLPTHACQRRYTSRKYTENPKFWLRNATSLSLPNVINIDSDSKNKRTSNKMHETPDFLVMAPFFFFFNIT